MSQRTASIIIRRHQVAAPLSSLNLSDARPERGAVGTDRDSVEAGEWHRLVSVLDGTATNPPTWFRCILHQQELVLDIISRCERVRTRCNERNQPLYRDDVVEWFLQPSPTSGPPHRYLELEVSPAGVIFDAWVTNAADATDVTSDTESEPTRQLDLSFNQESEHGPKVEVLLDGKQPDSYTAEEFAVGLEVSEWRTRIQLPLAYLANSSSEVSPEGGRAIEVTEPKEPNKQERTSDELRNLHMNVYRIQQIAGERVHQAWIPTSAIDFHRPQSFGKVVLPLER